MARARSRVASTAFVATARRMAASGMRVAMSKATVRSARPLLPSGKRPRGPSGSSQFRQARRPVGGLASPGPVRPVSLGPSRARVPERVPWTLDLLQNAVEGRVRWHRKTALGCCRPNPGNDTGPCARGSVLLPRYLGLDQRQHSGVGPPGNARLTGCPAIGEAAEPRAR